LHLHEVIDIVGEGARPYMEHTIAFDTERAADRGLHLFGTWQVVGMTGRWPQVVNIWAFDDGWEGWKRVLRAANVKRADNPALAKWWEEQYARRTGGFDRMLRAVGGIAMRPGEIFVHELSEVLPGSGPDYLTAVETEWAPVAAEFGVHLVAAYEVLFTDIEVVTVWATDADAHASLHATDDIRVSAWRTTARQVLTRWREELMVPCPGSPGSPVAR
jgi:hypothetical protein